MPRAPCVTANHTSAPSSDSSSAPKCRWAGYVGECYQEAIGVERDLSRARTWLERAVASGVKKVVKRAQTLLARLDRRAPRTMVGAGHSRRLNVSPKPKLVRGTQGGANGDERDGKRAGGKVKFESARTHIRDASFSLIRVAFCFPNSDVSRHRT